MAIILIAVIVAVAVLAVFFIVRLVGAKDSTTSAVTVSVAATPEPTAVVAAVPEATAVSVQAEQQPTTQEDQSTQQVSSVGQPVTTGASVYGTVLPGCTPVPASAFTYLPVFKQVQTDRKMIAITVDDCFQKGNLQTILKTTYDAGAKITIFPIGANIEREGISDILRDAWANHGIEIENHTVNHARVFRMSDEELRYEIYQQQVQVSQCLGVNYQIHFLRCMGGDGCWDQRTNNFLNTLGYLGIAHWGTSGSNTDLKGSQKKIAPGMIYLFHTTDHDTEILQKFIPWAVEQGYELVTLNELCGFPENETSDLSTLDTQTPQMNAFEWDYKDLDKGDYSWRTRMLQIELNRLGFLSDEAKQDGDFTGFYGDMTVSAVKQYQQSVGINATGVADAATQRALLG